MAKSSFNNVRIQLKNDTSENWQNSTLVLLAGEFAVENDTGLFKIGNGTDVFSALPYANDAAQVAKEFNELKDKIGTIPDDKTIIQLIEEAAASGGSEYDDSALKKRISDNEAAIATLTGDGDGSVKDTVAYQIAQVVAGADESYDTLKEIADWISNHSTDAASMSSQINTNKSDIAALKEKVGETAVADQISTAIDTALKNGADDKYALAADLATVNGKITSLQELVGETKVETQISTALDAALKVDGAEKYALASHSHEIANVKGLQGILDGKASASAVEAIQSAVDGLAAKAHEHSNKDILDGITEGKITAWDAAQANVIESIKLNGTAVNIAADKSVDIAIPAATSAALGLAQADGSTIEATDGVLSVKAVGISKVFVEEDTELVMNGGNA